VIRTARLLRAEGRTLDAADALEAALPGSSGSWRDEVLESLVDVLDELGDAHRLHPALEQCTMETPGALARAGLAWLAMGAFDRAEAAMAQLIERGVRTGSVLAVRVVAATFAGRLDAASAALDDIVNGIGIDRAAMLAAWRKGMIGRMLLDQRHGRLAATDPRLSVLRPLLAEVLSDSERQLAAPGLEAAQRADLEARRLACMAVIAGAAPAEPNRS
jgi:hypothetical protein